jgi:tetratricopeptide (TPR) repeat protein
MAVYDAFVSYSHARDKPIAAALQSVIQTLGKPWYRRRALRVFRDDTSLSATPQLWPSIEQALGSSRFLILLASPEAAASPWVSKEVVYWLKHKSADTVLIAVTEGELSWDNPSGDFVWREGAPLPPILIGRFLAEPKWVDLRAYRDGANPRDSRFIEAGADLAAAIHGMPKEDLLSQEVRQQRRALTLAWSAAGSLLVLAGLAGWQAKVALDNERVAIEHRQLAQQQRDRAENVLAAAMGTANTLVFDLAWELRDRAGMPRDLTRRILNRAQELQRQLADSGETAPALRRGEAIALSNLVLTLLALGDTTEALAAGQRARAIMEDLASIEADNTLWWRDRLVNHNRIGEALEALGRREEAYEEYLKSHRIAEKLVAADPGNTMWQDDLAVGFSRMANQLRLLGRRETALVLYRGSRMVIEKLAAVEPASTHWQRNLSVAISHIGNVLHEMGRTEEALAEYSSGHQIAEVLAAADPANTQWLDDLAASHSRFGNLFRARGSVDEALSAYRASLAINEKLATSDPTDTRWQQARSLGHNQIGHVLVAAGRREEALAQFRSSLAIMETLVAASPANTEWHSDVSASHANIGLVLQAMKQNEGALVQYRRSLEIAQRLAVADPGNSRRQRELSTAHAVVGDMLRTLGRREDAFVEYRSSLQITTGLAELDPGNSDRQFDLAVSLFRMSTFIEPARARPLVNRAIAILDPLAQAGKLTAEQRDWPRLLRELLATFPPEQVGAQ